MRKEYENTCKFGDCQQPSELASDKSQTAKQCAKNDKGKNLEYKIHAYSTVKVNGYCRYHNWFDEKKESKILCHNEK